MSENMRIWVEVAFNVTYLIVIWTLVAMMARRLSAVAPADRPVAKRLMWAFALLAIGDTGHVGFRVVAYARGGRGESGAGRAGRAFHRLHRHALLHADGGHLAAALPQTAGHRRVDAAGRRHRAADHHGFSGEPVGADCPPYDWSLLRNALLVIQGVGVMILILRDAFRTGDTTFKWIGG